MAEHSRAPLVGEWRPSKSQRRAWRRLRLATCRQFALDFGFGIWPDPFGCGGIEPAHHIGQWLQEPEVEPDSISYNAGIRAFCGGSFKKHGGMGKAKLEPDIIASLSTWNSACEKGEQEQKPIPTRGAQCETCDNGATGEAKPPPNVISYTIKGGACETSACEKGAMGKAKLEPDIIVSISTQSSACEKGVQERQSLPTRGEKCEKCESGATAEAKPNPNVISYTIKKGAYETASLDGQWRPQEGADCACENGEQWQLQVDGVGACEKKEQWQPLVGANSSCEKDGQWQLHEGAASPCEKDGQWQLREAVGACEKDGQWQPTVGVTSSCEKDGQWQLQDGAGCTCEKDGQWQVREAGGEAEPTRDQIQFGNQRGTSMAMWKARAEIAKEWLADKGKGREVKERESEECEKRMAKMEPDVISYSAGIRACESAGAQWEAKDVLGEWGPLPEEDQQKLETRYQKYSITPSRKFSPFTLLGSDGRPTWPLRPDFAKMVLKSTQGKRRIPIRRVREESESEAAAQRDQLQC